jgi:hypothetical protein
MRASISMTSRPDVNISRNDTLHINGASHGASDPYSGTLNLGEGSTFNMSVAWQTDSAIINVNTGGIIAGSVGAPATITGAAFTFGGGSINLDAVDSLRLSAPFTTTGRHDQQRGTDHLQRCHYDRDRPRTFK